MERRKFTREFKLEAVKLIQERGVTVAQAARDPREREHSGAQSPSGKAPSAGRARGFARTCGGETQFP